MKKLLFLTLALSLLLTGCSKDDDNGIGQFDYDTEILFGTWEFTHVMGMPWKWETTSATFYSNGTYYGRGYFGTGSGTYKLSGSRITCYVDGEKFMWYDVISLDDTEATLIASDNSGSITVKCRKQ
jgi:heat shock protein HslJ